MADETASSFLMKRAKAAKAKAAETIKPANQTPVVAPAETQHAVSQPLKPTQTAPRPVKPASARPPAAKSTETTQNEEGTNLDLAPGFEMADEEWDRKAIELFDVHSPNKLAFKLAMPMLPTVLRTILKGATLKGSVGYQDRITLFRMLGAPWIPQATSRGESGQGLDALADRMVRAVTRREGRMTVTLSADVVQEAQQIEGSAVERP